MTEMTRFQALLKAKLIAKRYFGIYRKFIYPMSVYYKLCEKYNLY